MRSAEGTTSKRTAVVPGASPSSTIGSGRAASTRSSCARDHLDLAVRDVPSL